MTRTSTIVIVVVLATVTMSAQRTVAPRPGIDWPSFRGIRASGVADGFALPTNWDVPSGRNVRWKVAVEGLGHSSPVIWGDHLCVTTATSGMKDARLKPGLYGDVTSVDDKTVHTWKLLCFDKQTGRVSLDKTILSTVPKIKRHLKSTHANTTLATDGVHLVAMLGSEGVYAFDMSGRQIWKKDLGVLDAGWYVDPTAQWEFSSSPVIHDGVLIVLADVQKNSFLAAFDVTNGKELWRSSRQDVPTFGTPTIHEVGATTEILVNGWRRTGAYDFHSGRSIWSLKGGGDIPVPTPIAANGLVYITSAHGDDSPVYAIRETATGDVSLRSGESTNANVRWQAVRQGSYMATPVAYRGLLYVCRWNGVLGVFDARTGDRLYQQRVGDGTTAFTASLVAGDGKVYVTGEEGDVYVLRAGPTFDVLARNSLDEVVMATPAISEGVLYFRTAQHIVAIASR
jgi:outer membrane protein assembly factor BamB